MSYRTVEGRPWDQQRNPITVHRTCQRNRLKGALELNETKTKGSKRTLTLPTQTAAALPPHGDRQEFDRKREREVCQGHNLIFCTITGGMGLLEVAHVLGHRNAAMVTTVYVHLAPDDHKPAAVQMDALL